MLRRLERLRALAAWERWLLARLILLLPLIGAVLHLLGFKRTRGPFARWVSGGGGQVLPSLVAPADQAERIARLVAIAAHHGPYRAKGGDALPPSPDLAELGLWVDGRVATYRVVPGGGQAGGS